jgi:hypothetical protein
MGGAAQGPHHGNLRALQHRHDCMQSLSLPDGIKVIHLSSGHYADDGRIFWKECLSLARAGYDVTFVVPGDPCFRREGVVIVQEGVTIVAVKRRSGRLGRMLATPIEVVIAGLRRNGLIYHFHDPELIPLGFLLRVLGKRVIYDAHEDQPRELLFKNWIPRGLRRPLSVAARVVEWIAGHTLSGVVAATPVIAQRFPRKHVALVQNFAPKSEFAVDEESPSGERRAVAYVGGITADRCAVEMVEAIPDPRHLLASWPRCPDGLVPTTAGCRTASASIACWRNHEWGSCCFIRCNPTSNANRSSSLNTWRRACR